MIQIPFLTRLFIAVAFSGQGAQQSLGHCYLPGDFSVFPYSTIQMTFILSICFNLNHDLYTSTILQGFSGFVFLV